MDGLRRDFLKLAAGSVASAGMRVGSSVVPWTDADGDVLFDVRRYGAVGDGKAIDSKARNAAIDAAAAAGGGTVYFPAGTYASYSLRLKSRVALYLGMGATLLATDTPLEGTTSGGYDAAEPQDPGYERFQNYGHNRWHNSLIWGEGLQDIAILGAGADPRERTESRTRRL